MWLVGGQKFINEKSKYMIVDTRFDERIKCLFPRFIIALFTLTNFRIEVVREAIHNTISIRHVKAHGAKDRDSPNSFHELNLDQVMRKGFIGNAVCFNPRKVIIGPFTNGDIPDITFSNDIHGESIVYLFAVYLYAFAIFDSVNVHNYTYCQY
jgi:hypothetical protein